MNAGLLHRMQGFAHAAIALGCVCVCTVAVAQDPEQNFKRAVDVPPPRPATGLGLPPLAPGPANAPRPLLVPRLLFEPQARLAIRGASFEEPTTGARYEQGTGPNTSEELERLLQKAVQVSSERPDLAPVLWQRVLDEGATTFAHGGRDRAAHRRRYEVYRPFAEETVQAMIGAGADSLKHYRLQYDGLARVLFAKQGDEREAALWEIVRRFFLSSVGDEAAFELACRDLEKGDFTAADLILERLQSYPGGNISADEIAIRRAVALSRLGRNDRAAGLLSTLGDSSPTVNLVRLNFAEHVTATTSTRNDSSEWAVAGGNPSRTGLMPAPGGVVGLPESSEFVPAWEYRPPWVLKGTKTSSTGNQAIMSGVQNGRPMIFIRQNGGSYTQATLDDKELPELPFGKLATLWRDGKWRPANEPLLFDGRLYLKSENRLVCCDPASGEVLWMGRPTRTTLDESTKQLALVMAHGVNLAVPSSTIQLGSQPKTLTELLLFSDHLHYAMAGGGGVVYSIEGPLTMPSAVKKSVDGRLGIVEMQASRTAGRINELAAYDAATGRLKWMAAGASVNQGGVYYNSAPLPLGDQVIVTFAGEGQLGVVALRAADGSVAWKSTLAQLTPKMSPFIPAMLAADDGCLYVASGAGTLFSIDLTSGSVRFAITYPRMKFGSVERNSFEGTTVGGRIQIIAQENVLIRSGSTLIALPCDSDHVMAFDVTDGSLKWDSPLPPSAVSGGGAYSLGVLDGRLYLGNSGLLWRINLTGGRIEWERPLDASCGRGLLAAGGLLVPQGRTVLVIDPATGDLRRTMPIETPDIEPVGNLISDGQQLLVASAARMFAIKPKPAEPAKTEGTEEKKP